MKKSLVVLTALCMIFVMVFAFSACNGSEADDTATTTINDGKIADSQLQLPKKGDTIAVMQTSMGEIKIRLFPEHAPNTVQNFIDLAESGKYDDTIFHRVVKDYIIQGGDYEKKDGTGGKAANGEYIDDEFSDEIFNVRGSLAMSNIGTNTNGSQFYINHAGPEKFVGWEALEERWQEYKALYEQIEKINQLEKLEEQISYTAFLNTDKIPYDVKNLYTKYGGNPILDGAFNEMNRGNTVFGQVFEGMDIVDKISAVEVTKDAFESKTKPVEDVIVKKIEIVKYEG